MVSYLGKLTSRRYEREKSLSESGLTLRVPEPSNIKTVEVKAERIAEENAWNFHKVLGIFLIFFAAFLFGEMKITGFTTLTRDGGFNYPFVGTVILIIALIIILYKG